ncbi:DUF4231 domain-containing protein [Microtetraspora malaysiensis]|uniref:DUF4231 domain-containing protein n=1 Tax=Microtetraspora malaysiensis TaxID=161358 RepID=UPI003D902767
MISLEEFPAIFRAADRTAILGQRRLLVTTGLRLGTLVTAATFGASSLKVAGIDLAAVIAAGALACALVLEVYLLTAMPGHQWSQARVGAETARSLAWRYIAGGEPFGCDGQDEQKIDDLLLRRLGSIARDLHPFAPIPLSDEDAQLTATMRRLRRLPLDERRRRYLAERVDDQRAWYRGKAMANERRASRWSVTLAVLEAIGLVAAVLNGANVLNVDLPGIVGAFGAAGIAWVQTRQYRRLASAYSLAALELGDIVARAEWPSSEEEWARFVHEAEETISREHTLWRTSHG